MSGYCPAAARRRGSCRPRADRENYKNGINSFRKSQRLCYNDRLEPDAATGTLHYSGSGSSFGSNTQDAIDAAVVNVIYMLNAVDSALAEYDAGFTMKNFGFTVDYAL